MMASRTQQSSRSRTRIRELKRFAIGLHTHGAPPDPPSERGGNGCSVSPPLSEGGQGGVLKSSSCTSLVFIRIPFGSPPLEKGGQGGYPRETTAWCAFPDGCPPRNCRIGPTYWLCLFNPPCPPSQGGDVPITRNKNTRLESRRSSSVNPTFQHPSRGGAFASALARQPKREPL